MKEIELGASNVLTIESLVELEGRRAPIRSSKIINYDNEQIIIQISKVARKLAMTSTKQY